MNVQEWMGARFDGLHERIEEVRRAQAATQAQVMEALRGEKYVRLPLVTGTASGSALTMGGEAASAQQAPAEGYVWSVRLIVIEGMTASSTTPDIMNIRRGTGGRILWQLNGNQFAQTFGRGEMILFPGETLAYSSVGTFAATGLITAHGMAENLPAEMIGKFYS